MLVNELEAKILSHELQLKEQLNECVHQKRRSDFALMLSMLSDDVRQQSQFILPESNNASPNVNNDVLRKRFELPDAQSLAIDEISQLDDFNQAQDVQQQRLTDIKLREALKPLPLAFRDNAKHIPTQVIENTSIHCQQRNKAPKQPIAQKLDFDAMAWLNTVQNTIVKSQLLASA